MSTNASFSLSKKQLLSALKHMKKIEKSVRKKDSTLEVTVITGFIRLVIPGVDLHLGAATCGTAKFTIRLWYLTDIVTNEAAGDLQFTVGQDVLKLRGFTWNVPTTFFETDRILRSINLPSNYKYLDLVRLYLSERYTQEEIDFNNLDSEVTDAFDKLNSELDKTSSTLRKYGVSRGEVEELVLKRLNL